MRRVTIRIAAALAVLAAPLSAFAAPIHAVLYKNPQCSCCESYAAYLELVEEGVEALTEIRDTYASTLEEDVAEDYERDFDREVERRLPRFTLGL